MPLRILRPGFGGPGRGGRGGFGGPPQPGQVMPAFLQDTLQLTAEQKKQMANLPAPSQSVA